MYKDIINNITLLLYNSIITQYDIFVSMDEIYRKLDKHLSTLNMSEKEVEILDKFLKKSETINNITKILKDLMKKAITIKGDIRVDMTNMSDMVIFIQDFINMINNYSINMLNMRLRVNLIIELVKCIVITILKCVIKEDKENVLNIFKNIFRLLENTLLLDKVDYDTRMKMLYICC